MRKSVTLTIFKELRFRGRNLHHSAGSKSIPDSHNARRTWIGEGTKEQGVHDAENSRVRPDAKRESNHSNDSEPKIFVQLPQRVANVLEDSGHFISSFVPQRHHRINFGRAARRYEACR